MDGPGGTPSDGDRGARRVDDAFLAQPRRGFLPASVRGQAPLDQPLPIGFGQTNSQPTTVREMLHLLDVRPGMRVLEVGSGTGWVVALLAELVGAEGSVLGTERIARLVESGATNLRTAGVPWARMTEARDDALGAPDEAPFDRILVSAMADKVPRELVAQLAPGGVMVAPVRGRMLRIVRGLPPHDDPADAVTTEHGLYRFVPLIVP
ncbi:protein-L-isoaspartate O-methyltransferase family protein [Demequina pelophila]|uniref:protein-L-isoaspartate O-methyltransferase family protein n=1 Tax=Demequina pelophila TaxID=1638984 RepID=UPI00078190B5|nr:protein-L-isoaspartate O-methyltransferase [Demequina pelophila]